MKPNLTNSLTRQLRLKRQSLALPLAMFALLVSLTVASSPAFAQDSSTQNSSTEKTAPANEAAEETGPTESPIIYKAAEDKSAFESTVGFPKLIFQHVIRGSKVVAKPITDPAQAMIIRIVETYPHGSDFRYDIEYKGLEPGKYNLADYLKRETGEEAIPAIPVTIKSLLGPGQIKPGDPPTVSSEFRSYYLPMLLVAAAGWLGGLLMILFYGRGKTKRPESHQVKVTVADRMRPLIDAAVAGKLNSKEQAELERVLSSFWSKKLRLGHLPADQLRERLRNHPEASVMLNQIDSWLHRPATDQSNQVDVGKILEPYQSVNYEEIS